MSDRDSQAEEPDIVIGSREQLLHLIAEAAEIEHTLMCTYLYAAFSLKSGVRDGLSATESEAVERWRNAIMSVAIDEMVHLLLVSNLAVSIGGRPHFGRPNFPVESGYFPSGVVVKLAPFSLETLDHFIYLERPQGHVLLDGEGFEAPREYSRDQPYIGLMPSVQDYATVSRLYEALRVNLTICSTQMGEDALFASSASAQIDRTLVDLEGVARITDLSSALAAIDTIVEQGEGSGHDREDSHYRKFQQIREEYRQLLERHPEFTPAWPVAESPVMRRPPTPDGKVFIEHPRSVRVLDFANAIYALLLRCLIQVFECSIGDDRAEQDRFMQAALQLMHILSDVSTALVKLPARYDGDSINAGTSFTMLRSVAPLLGWPVGSQLVRERIDELHRASRAVIRASPSLASVVPRLDALRKEFGG